MQKAPATYRVKANFAANELSYADMVLLAETFVRWAIEEPDVAPHHRTMLIEVGVDYEKLAEWVGPCWKAANPSDAPCLFRDIAELVRRADV